MADRDKTKAQLLQELADLRASEEKWRTLVCCAPDYIAIVDREGKFQFLNRTQPGHSLEMVDGRRIYDYIEREFHERARACLEHVFRTGEAASYETKAAGPVGESAWYETHMGPVKGGDQVVAVALFSTDITPRKTAESALQQARDSLEQQVERRTAELVQANQQLNEEIDARTQSEERYRLLVETTSDLIWELDQTGAYTYLSPPVKDWLGYEAAELIGRSPFEFMPPEEATRLRTMFAEKLSAGEGAKELEVISLHRDGRRVVHEVNVAPVFDGTGTCCGFRGISRDITERQRTEKSLRQSHEELQAIYDGMVDGLLIADVETKQFVRANQAMSQMLGYTEEELLSLTVRDIHPPKDIANVLAIFQAQVEGKIQVAENLPVLRRDGSVFYADITTNHLDYQERLCNIGFFRDITERKKAAEVLRREHRVLRQLLNSHDRERQIIAYEIHDGLAQQLAAAIMQFESFVRKGTRRSADASHTSQIVLELLRQCLAETRRLISGLRPPILDQFGIVAALQNLATESQENWQVGVDFRYEVAFDQLEPLLENAIYRIAQESLTNACRHSQSDRVRMELMQQGMLVRVSVQDWGTGFDPENVDERCFGLAGIRERARLLGGTVVVHTQLGKGSHITVDLPVTTVDLD